MLAVVLSSIAMLATIGLLYSVFSQPQTAQHRMLGGRSGIKTENSNTCVVISYAPAPNFSLMLLSTPKGCARSPGSLDLCHYACSIHGLRANSPNGRPLPGFC